MKLIIKRFNFSVRQKSAAVVIICSAVFLLFYWTFLIINSRHMAVMEETKLTAEKIIKVGVLVSEISSHEQGNMQKASLLAFIQGINDGSLYGKISNIKQIGGSGNREQVSFKAESLTYAELGNVIDRIEIYDNLQIRSISINKRFDNNKRVDAFFDVVKLK